METWRLLAGLSGMLVLYAVLVTVFDFETTAVDVVAAIVFGAIGLYLGNVLTNRLNAEEK